VRIGELARRSGLRTVPQNNRALASHRRRSRGRVTLIAGRIAAAPAPLPRPEAVIYGLGLAAYDVALKLCEDAGYKYPDQHAHSLNGETSRQVQDMLLRAQAEIDAEESEKLAQEFGIRLRLLLDGCPPPHTGFNSIFALGKTGSKQALGRCQG
jgi:hypothetical protein